MARDWLDRIAAAIPRRRARDLYAGRAFTEVRAAESLVSGGVYVVSAGLGLIDLDHQVPGYSLTVAGDVPDNILKKLSNADFTRPSDWWTALASQQGLDRPLSRMIQENNGTLFVLALPSAYMALVHDDLSRLSLDDASRVRVIGLVSLKSQMPKRIQSSLIPYDERLEASRGFAGTRSDFPQRAARHFLAHVLPRGPGGSIAEHARHVEDLLAPLSAPLRQEGLRHSDDQIKEVIRSMWNATEGRVTSSLRMLRRERKIACEQSRFKRLFWEVAEEFRSPS